jgi:hypothetical protein
MTAEAIRYYVPALVAVALDPNLNMPEIKVDIDKLYPHLSRIAQSQKTSLQELGDKANANHDNYLSLGDSCWGYINGLPRHGNAICSSVYLPCFISCLLFECDIMSHSNRKWHYFRGAGPC